MATELIFMIQSIIGLVTGIVIGAGFGFIQNTARRRNERLQNSGKLESGWAVMPGSGKRIAFFLVALVLVQIICPLLFKDATKWWVSGGVVAGYGFMLVRRILQGRTNDI